MAKYAILCVDDERIVLDSLQEQLESVFGNLYDYDVAESVEEAWEVIEDFVSNGYEKVLVITDWLMPRIKGDEFLVDLHKKHPDYIKIMLTGQADPKAVENAYNNANLYAYIRKPWSADDLVDHVRKAMI